MIELLDKEVRKILTVFSISPGSKFNRETLKKKTIMNNVTLNKTLYSLINLKVITKEKNLFFLNFERGDVKEIITKVSKDHTRFKQPPLKFYFLMLDLLATLSEIRSIGDIYLFGSYAKLTFKENSDVDIAIVSDKIKKEEVAKSVRKIEKKYKKTIEVHYFSRKFYRNKKDPLVKDILQNGIKLL